MQDEETGRKWNGKEGEEMRGWKGRRKEVLTAQSADTHAVASTALLVLWFSHKSPLFQLDM